MAINIQDDLRLEEAETIEFSFVVGNATGAVVVDLPTLVITIQDDEGKLDTHYYATLLKMNIAVGYALLFNLIMHYLRKHEDFCNLSN